MVSNNNHVVIFIDRVATKNKLQVDVLNELGYRVTFFVNAYNSSIDFLENGDLQIELKSSFFSRIKQVFSFFFNQKRTISHAEIYPGGRFSFIYLFFSFLFRVKTICVERGDLLYFNKEGYSLLTRCSMWVCYKFSDIVWYREIYMEPILRKMNIRRLFFLHNAIQVPDHAFPMRMDQKSVDFLWLNRIIPERRSDWFIKVLCNKEFEHTENIIAGFLTKTSYTKEQDYVLKNKPNNLKALDYVSHPSTLYMSAKFFVLPAKIIFANNSLLEAMSYGVVPIVTNALGANLIVEHEHNGFVADFNENSLAMSMKKALDLSPDEYIRMSTSAKNHVFKNFSPEFYIQKLTELYQLIQN